MRRHAVSSALIRRRPWWITSSVLLGAALIGAPLLASCASTPDPKTTRDSLVEVTEEPVPPAPDSPYDAELFPDPIVEPLECYPYLVVTARGTGEPKRKQLLATVARSISDARPDDVQQLDLDYPADTDVNEGGEVGARILVDTLNVQAEACPAQRFILLGYSQGALVVGDALSDPEFRLVGTNVGEVSEEAADQIIAIVFYGNPRFVGVEPYDTGSFSDSVNGLLPRPVGSLDEFADRIRDYCVARDFVCQSSLDLDGDGHIAYYSNGMQQDGAAFAITKLAPIVDEGEHDSDAEANAETNTEAGAQTDAGADEPTVPRT